MRPNIRPLPAITSLLTLWALLFAGVLAFEGCKGTPNRVAYQSITVTRLSVSTAMGLFNVWVKDQTAKGVDTKPTEQKVKDAWEKWHAANLVVLDIGRANAVATSTNASGATGVSAAIEDAVANATQYKTDLFNLLTQIGVNLPL